ncbi:DUF1376 domain-containing protein [Acetobacter lambici]|uniref:YdaU family protein n=1 Tax=Acetobacter lambici TaxID=1332824 RepID=A0ABT1F294_9PROT|nr:DUF1376 domain-containing protein [Acetobacter lambici]MCP1241754.1 YdaU family protein [Acetobacter lambici]MCP1257879.1 YdaU family protein [Acetobacter lambici]NHO57563.1 DUF1376 domain-containing protein [Acetobacter lambici]
MNNAHTSLPDAVQEPHRPFPAPLTPPQSDLRGLPFMPLDTCRLLDSDLFALSTGDGFKCAVALWCKAWQQVPAGSLPHNERVLAHLSGAGGRWPGLRAVALHGWVVCSDGRLYHPVIAQKANQAWKARLAQRARAARRWGREPEDTSIPAAEEGAAWHGTAHAHARESERERESSSLRSLGDDNKGVAHGQGMRGKVRARGGRGVGRAPHPLEEQAARLKQRKAAPGHGPEGHAECERADCGVEQGA